MHMIGSPIDFIGVGREDFAAGERVVILPAEELEAMDRVVEAARYGSDMKVAQALIALNEIAGTRSARKDE